MKLDTIAIVQTVRAEQAARPLVHLPTTCHRDYRTEIVRAIDGRPCDPLAAEDSDWGEQDSLANIPRRGQPSWVRALALPAATEGDR